jgi:hypothetical protein
VARFPLEHRVEVDDLPQRLRSPGQHMLLGRLGDAVQSAQHRDGQDDPVVLRLAVVTPQRVGNRPDERCVVADDLPIWTVMRPESSSHAPSCHPAADEWPTPCLAAQSDVGWFRFALSRSCQGPRGFPRRRPGVLPGDGHAFSPGTATGCPREWPSVVPGDGRGVPGVSAGSVQARGVTPLPVRASARRMLSPSVTSTWAWWSSRSTRAVAMVRSMSWSNPEGCRFELMARLRRS